MREAKKPLLHQEEPPGDWWLWEMHGWRGAGKTCGGAMAVLRELESDPEAKILLVGPSLRHVKEVMVKGPSGIGALPKNAEVATEKTDLRGCIYDLIWWDEPLNPFMQRQQALQLLPRIAKGGRIIITGSPPAGVVTTSATAMDNPHIPPRLARFVVEAYGAR